MIIKKIYEKYVTKDLISCILVQLDGEHQFPERDSQSGESTDHVSSPHGVWTRKCEGGERPARAHLAAKEPVINCVASTPRYQ